MKKKFSQEMRFLGNDNPALVPTCTSVVSTPFSSEYSPFSELQYTVEASLFVLICSLRRSAHCKMSISNTLANILAMA